MYMGTEKLRIKLPITTPTKYYIADPIGTIASSSFPQ